MATLVRVLEQAKEIWEAHTHKTKLKESLEKRRDNWDRDQIISVPIESAVCFLRDEFFPAELIDCLELILFQFVNSEMQNRYRLFVLEHSNCQAKLKQFRSQIPSFDSFITDWEDTARDKLNLEALLMKPIQRLPQLILILQVHPVFYLEVCSVGGS